MRKIKTITSISVILTILCCCIVTCYAKTSNYDDTYNCLDSSYEIEVSTEELENGVDITAYYTDNGKIVLKKANKNDKLLLGTTSYPTFSVSLVTIGNDRAILSWNATASCLKKVTGTVYCRDTKVFSSKTYYSKSISCPYLDGTEGRANSATASFYVPSKKTTYRVGFSGVIVRTIAKDYYFGNGSSTVTK